MHISHRVPVTCRECGHGPYIPCATIMDFHPDTDESGRGLCTTCFRKEEDEKAAKRADTPMSAQQILAAGMNFSGNSRLAERNEAARNS